MAIFDLVTINYVIKRLKLQFIVEFGSYRTESTIRLRDKYQSNRMGGACGTDGGVERRGAYRVWWRKLKERRTWKTEV